MVSDMSFSVVIPIYNSSLFIEATLDSIRSASAEDIYEVLLVDDCSQDLFAIKKLISKYPELRLVEKPEKTNAADSRNVGFLESIYDFVFFLDSDDLLIPGTIDRRIQLHKERRAGVMFGNFIKKSRSVEMETSLDPYNSEDFRDYLFFRGGDIRSSTVSIYKPFHKKTLFDPLSFKHQDWIFGIRLSENSENIYFDPVSHAVINTNRAGRMSSSLNISASKYFCENYLKRIGHVNSFSKKNWLTMIQNRDDAACSFFFSIFVAQTLVEKIKFHFYYVASRRPFIYVSSRFIGMIRRRRS